MYIYFSRQEQLRKINNKKSKICVYIKKTQAIIYGKAPNFMSETDNLPQIYLLGLQVTKHLSVLLTSKLVLPR